MTLKELLDGCDFKDIAPLLVRKTIANGNPHENSGVDLCVKLSISAIVKGLHSDFLSVSD